MYGRGLDIGAGVGVLPRSCRGGSVGAGAPSVGADASVSAPSVEDVCWSGEDEWGGGSFRGR